MLLDRYATLFVVKLGFSLPAAKLNVYVGYLLIKNTATGVQSRFDFLLPYRFWIKVQILPKPPRKNNAGNKFFAKL